MARYLPLPACFFIASKDEGKLRAYDQETGNVLWSTSMPASSEGVPAIYEVDGREFIVVCATSAKQTQVRRDGPEEPSAEPLHRTYIAYGRPKNFSEQEIVDEKTEGTGDFPITEWRVPP